jgi:hypothetical protein
VTARHALTLLLIGGAWLKGCGGQQAPVEEPAAGTARIVANVRREGAPAAGLDVYVWRRGWAAIPGNSGWQATTDAQGVYRIEGLPAREYLTLDVYEDGERVRRWAERLRLASEEEHEVTIDLSVGCTLEGVILEQDGRPVPGFPLDLRVAEFPVDGVYLTDGVAVLSEAVTDSEGRFLWEGLGHGDWLLTPRGYVPGGPEKQPAPVARLVSIEPGELHKAVVLRLHRGLYIRGNALDSGGEPDAAVFLSATNGATSASADTQEDGTFRIGPLIPGEYELVARSYRSPFQAPSLRTTAEAGEKGVTLLLRAGGTISGSCSDRDGEAVACRVTLFPVDSEVTDSQAWSDPPSADFSFTALLPGNYDLRGLDDHGNVGWLENVEVEAEVSLPEQRLVLSPGARVRTRILAGPRPYLYTRIVREERVLALAEDAVVEPGDLSVELWIIEGLEERQLEARSVTVAAGEEVEVVFEMSAGKGVRSTLHR